MIFIGSIEPNVRKGQNHRWVGGGGGGRLIKAQNPVVDNPHLSISPQYARLVKIWHWMSNFRPIPCDVISIYNYICAVRNKYALWIKDACASIASDGMVCGLQYHDGPLNRFGNIVLHPTMLRPPPSRTTGPLKILCVELYRICNWSIIQTYSIGAFTHL